ncbi:MAG: hypothetical protein QGI95_01075 [Dehalococcoidales bacterium]|jgi:hypothetical protein|nr:hypothetical protein [Dehalococcoidales bacterium]
MLGSTGAWFSLVVLGLALRSKASAGVRLILGGIQVGLIGCGGGTAGDCGVVGGLVEGVGEMSILGRAHPELSAREKIRIREIARNFTFGFFTTD